MRCMNRLALILLAALLGVGTVAATSLVSLDRVAENTASGEFTYTVMLEPTTRLENVTMLLPVPEPWPAELSEDLVMSAPGDAKNWTLGVQETGSGPMLAVSAPLIAPRDDGEPSLIKLSWTTSGVIDTRNPIGHEPVLSPREGHEVVPCPTDATTMPSETRRCLDYATRAYAGYLADDTAAMNVTVHLSGLNKWWEMGWTQNSYHDGAAWTFQGSPEGWVEARANIVAGEGRYR